MGRSDRPGVRRAPAGARGRSGHRQYLGMAGRSPSGPAVRRADGRAAEPLARRQARPDAARLPAVQPQAWPPDGRGARRVRRPVRGWQRGVMRVFPREILRSRAYLEEVRSNLPRLADKPAVIVWPDSDPGFGDAELAHWQSLFPTAPTVILSTDRPVHRRGRAGGRRGGRQIVVARRCAQVRRKGSAGGAPGGHSRPIIRTVSRATAPP